MSAGLLSGLTLLFCVVFWELVVQRIGCLSVILLMVMLATSYEALR